MTTTETATAPVAWIAVDWGTSNVRLWAMAEDGRVLDKRTGTQGMAGLKPGEFDACFQSLVAGWAVQKQPLQVVVCGMAGAREGWVQAGYRAVPVDMRKAGGAVQALCSISGWTVHILPGLSQALPPDVMRGEETQIAGLVRREPGFAGTVILPGTHSKWARVANGMVEAFATVMTGELFSVIAGHSILARSMAVAGWDDAAFAAGADAALADPAGLSRLLFGARAGALLNGTGPQATRAFVSGLLIGSEIAGCAADYPAGDTVIIGEGALSALYAQALARAGRPSRTVSAEDMTLAGLAAAQQTLDHNDF